MSTTRNASLSLGMTMGRDGSCTTVERVRARFGLSRDNKILDHIWPKSRHRQASRTQSLSHHDALLYLALVRFLGITRKQLCEKVSEHPIASDPRIVSATIELSPAVSLIIDLEKAREELDPCWTSLTAMHGLPWVEDMFRDDIDLP